MPVPASCAQHWLRAKPIAVISSALAAQTGTSVCRQMPHQEKKRWFCCCAEDATAANVANCDRNAGLPPRWAGFSVSRAQMSPIVKQTAKSPRVADFR
ncbi:hypothetical protein AVEN_188534-1 [Araneus ventricosus]|uniref:Uncharacterized protein n=1 Tax=Araneus ventricosus TaxID=182803 RepID=A0A4Y2VU72_ARAVE|nr:hypothetical protein AVEN_188534-1 [Araneus ventricosus]